MRYITLSEYLRPWVQLGVTHLLPDYSEREDTVRDNLQNDSLTSTKLSSPIQNVDPFSNGTSSSQYNDSSHAQCSLKETLQPHSLEEEKKTSCSYEFPTHWEAQLSKTSSSRVVWSYPELGFDLNGRTVPERSMALKSLIGKLNLPKGANSFWPMALPDNQGELVIDIDAYLFGLEKISPQVVLLLGQTSSSILFPLVNLEVSFTQQLVEGRLYILLPDLLSIYSDPISLEKTHLYLKSVFSSLNIFSFK